MKSNTLIKLTCLLGLLGLLAAPTLLHADSVVSIDWQPTKTDTWQGFTRHYFTVDGCPCWVAVPAQPRPGNHWVWCMEFPTAFDTRTGVVPLVQNGFYYVHMSVGNTYGAPSAQAHLDAFYDHLVAKGLNKKGTLIGVSRGGLYAYRFAANHPERVLCVYGDAPVCDFKSWPGGLGKGKGSASDWENLQKIYGFKDVAEALAYKGNPIDILAPLAKAGIPLIHVVGDADDVVPVAENTAIIEERYQALGGTIKVFHKPGVGHHPHGLDDPAPLVELIMNYTKRWERGAPYPQHCNASTEPRDPSMLRTRHSRNASAEARKARIDLTVSLSTI